MLKATIPALLVALMLFSSFIFTNTFAQVAKGPNVNTIKFIAYPDENIALEELKSGNIDAYFWRIPLERVPGIRDDPKVKIYDRTAGSFGLYLNPAEPKDSSAEMNPFQYREVRFALNYLVDREFVVNEILKGHGTPMVDPFGPYSPEYLNVIDVVESFGFRHDPALADKMISDRLTIAGATKENARWVFNGNPVVIKMLIRCDDTRRNSLGESLASDLEKIGFTVEKICVELSGAQLTVYGSDPQELKWHIYTEGYAGTSVFVKYNPVISAQMYAPWFANMPGAADPSFWQYKNETLDEVTQRISQFDFTSESERNELVRKAVMMGIQESVRLFVVQTSEPYAASSSLTGLVNDFGAGITSSYSLVNAKSDNNDSLNIGVKQLSAGSWNNVAGFKDTFSRTISDALSDSGMSKNPYTGDVIPVRLEWTDIETAGPSGTVSIHPDAQKWDPYSQRWKTVGETTENESSKSKVTYKIHYSKWHNDIPMDKADLLYGYYFTFEWGTSNQTNDTTVDSEYTSQIEVVLPLIKGIRFLSDDEVESYVDVWHYDEKEIADYISVWSGEPWEITAATERLVVSGKLAYSRGEATSKGIDWLSTISPLHADTIRLELQKMKSEGYVPAALKGIVKPEEAISRYDASIKWITEHRNAVISNGPFYLDDFNAEAQTATIKAFRDESYPFEQGHWSSFGNPMIASINKIDTGGSIVIGQPKPIQVYISIAGQPNSDAQVEYFISGREGTILKGQGEPVSNEPGKFEINLQAEETSKLSAGPATFKVFVTGNKAYRPDFRVLTVLISTGAGVTNGGAGSSTPTQPDNQPPPSGTNNQPSGCLIATAAFGSELTPQVQYLRNFRDNYILSTASGSAFMNIFNSVYYSFSPQVADYERENPWLQKTVKISLYPLFGILMLSERAHSSVGGGEAGAVLAGTTVSVLIGAVYLSLPAAALNFVKGGNRKFSLNFKGITIVLVVLGGLTAAIAIGAVAGNTSLLSVTSATFVLVTTGISALAAGKAFFKCFANMRTKRQDF